MCRAKARGNETAGVGFHGRVNVNSTAKNRLTALLAYNRGRTKSEMLISRSGLYRTECSPSAVEPRFKWSRTARVLSGVHPPLPCGSEAGRVGAPPARAPSANLPRPRLRDAAL